MKKPRRRRELLNPLYLLDGKRKLSPANKTLIKSQHHSAMSEIVHGRGQLPHWQAVAYALNTCKLLCSAGTYWGSDYKEEVEKALKAHANCGVRFKSGKSMGYTGPELEQVNIVLDLYDQQVELLTVEDFERVQAALAEAIARGETTIVVSALHKPMEIEV